MTAHAVILAAMVVVTVSCVCTAALAGRLSTANAWGHHLTGLGAYVFLWLMVTSVLVTTPVWLPLGWLLHRYGRAGFWTVEENGAISLQFTSESFQR